MTEAVPSPFETRLRSPALLARRRAAPRLLVQLFTIASGAALIVLAAGMNRPWLDRHMLSDLTVPDGWRMALVTAERLMLVAAGIALLWPIRRRVVRGIQAGDGRRLALQIAVGGCAILLALVVSELLLRAVIWRQDPPWRIDREPPRRADPYLGWANVPGRTTVDHFYPRPVTYVIDSHGYRVASADRPVDYRRPSILFTGESILFGSGLRWDETIAGRMQAMTGMQSVNLAVSGYATDQASLALRRDLPRFRRPVAVVAIFSPALMERNLRHNKPWLDAGGVWHPAQPEWRLQHLARFLLPYHRKATIDAALAATRAALVADVAAAHAHGAAALVLVPIFQPERPADRALRQAMFAGQAIPHVEVSLDPAWRLAPDYHPDARADQAMALAIVATLGQLPMPR